MNIRSFAKIIAIRPRTVLLLFTLLTIIIGSQATNVYMQSDFSNYLQSDDPTLQLWTEMNREFQLGQTVIILIHQDETREFNDVRYYEVLREMDGMYRTIYENLEKEGKETHISSVNSLAILIREENAKKPLLGGNDDDVIPTDSDDIYRYMERTTISSMKGVLYTDDYKYAVIIIQLKQDGDYNQVLNRVENAIENRGAKYANMTVTGTAAMQRAVQRESMNRLLIVFPIAIFFVSIVLVIFHRSLKSIIIAFLPPAFALILTFGTLGIVAPELTLISVAIVALIMGLGVDYSIHLMNRLIDERNIPDKITRIEKILRSTGKAVFLSTVTTVIGFGSLMISSMSPMVNFGFACAIGILFSFISAIILVPSLVILLESKKTGVIPNWKKFANFTMNNSKRIIFIASFFAILSLIFLPQIETDVNFFDIAPEGVPELDALYEYSDQFGDGGNFNAFLVETDPYGLEDPEVIDSIYETEQKMRATGVNVSSIADALVEINDILDRSTILDKFTNLTDADNIIFDRIASEGIVNKDHSKTLIVVTIPIGKSIEEIESIVNQLNSIATNASLPHNGKISKLTGQDAVNIAVNRKLTDEQVRSMILALILVLAVLIYIFNSAKYGFLTMIPVLFVLMWEPGFLAITNIPLSVVTITIASIMIGIGIDYGVHITHRVREELERGASKNEAIRIAIEKTGLSLVEAALTTIFGIGSIFFVGIPALSEFVIVIIFMVAMSCIAAALILPIFYKLKFIK